MLLGFHSPACCLPPFAIQMSMYEASCEAEAALLSSVSHWRQSFLALASELKPFLVDFSVGKSEQFVAPQYVCMWGHLDVTSGDAKARNRLCVSVWPCLFVCCA